MENSEYYHALAERIVARGARVGEFDSFTTYKTGKDIEDLRKAVNEATLVSKEGEPNLAERLYEVLEIDTKAFDNQSDRL